jgi:hypothetical protein
LQAYPLWGPYPALCALVYGGLFARLGAPLLGPSYGRTSPCLCTTSLTSRRLIHGLLLVPQARHLRLLLPQASIGSHDRPIFAILLPRAGDRAEFEQWSGRGRCAQREQQGLALSEQPRWLQPPHAEQFHERLTPQRTESIERKQGESKPSGQQEQATRERVVIRGWSVVSVPSNSRGGGCWPQIFCQ